MIRAIPVKSPPVFSEPLFHEVRPSACSEKADILSIISSIEKQWIEYRGIRLSNWLGQKEITHRYCFLYPETELAKIIKNTNAKIVLNECMCCPPDVVLRLSKQFPNIKFVNIIHGVPSLCASQMPEKFYKFITLAQACDNIYVATVSDPQAQAWLLEAKVIYLPNLVEVPKNLIGVDPLPYDKEKPLCVSIVARSPMIKNWGGMISAVGILAQRRSVKALLVGRKDDSTFRAHQTYLLDLGIEVEAHAMGDWEENLIRVHEQVHVGMACGYSDSLNLVAAEHCLLGIPVVGSTVISWLPKNQRACPQDPVAMANIAERLVDTPGAWKVGRNLVKRMAKQNEITLLSNLRNLFTA